jgi:hypothetical protein
MKIKVVTSNPGKCNVAPYKKGTFLIPAIPFIVLSEGTTVMLSLSTVDESSEIPPLPVSKIKFSESGWLSTVARSKITPPVREINRKLVKSLEGSSTNCS